MSDCDEVEVMGGLEEILILLSSVTVLLLLLLLIEIGDEERGERGLESAPVAFSLLEVMLLFELKVVLNTVAGD